MSASRPAAAAFLTVALSATAWAYLAPAPSIIKRLEVHRDEIFRGVRTLAVHGQFTFYGDEARAAGAGFKIPDVGDEATLSGELDYRFPGKCALNVQAPSGVAADAAMAGNIGGRLKAVGPELTSLKVQAALACPLIYQKSDQHGDADAALIAFLQGLGVDFETVSLMRFNGTIVYAIGAKALDLSKPQFWVSKGDAPEPRRLIANFGGKLYDVRLLDYTSWHPREIDVYQGTTLLSKFLADKADENVKGLDVVF